MRSCYKTLIEQQSNLELLIQVLSDILVDRINDRVMTSVYAEIKGGWTVKQKVKEQVGFNFYVATLWHLTSENNSGIRATIAFELLRIELCNDESKEKGQGSYLYTHKPQKLH